MNFYESFREEYGEYIVKAGDSLFKIAKDSNTTVEELMTLNNLASTTIYPNQILLIPNSTSNSNVYTTVTGDTLNKIANKANISVDRLIRLNNYKDFVLTPNQEVRISEERTYTISPGDTLEGIAKKYNTSIKDLVNQNIDSWFLPGKTINI